MDGNEFQVLFKFINWNIMKSSGDNMAEEVKTNKAVLIKYCKRRRLWADSSSHDVAWIWATHFPDSITGGRKTHIITDSETSVFRLEDALVPVMNASRILQSKAHGFCNVGGPSGFNDRILSIHGGDKGLFHRPESEESGQCDFEMDDHFLDLDLKLFETECMLNVASYVSPGEEMLKSSAGIFLSEYEQSRLALDEMAKYSHEFFFIEDICREGRFTKTTDSPQRQNAQKQIRRRLEKRKNIVFLYPNCLETDLVGNLECRTRYMLEKLDEIFYQAFEYRHNAVRRSFKTFFAFMLDATEPSDSLRFAFCIAEVKDGHLDQKTFDLMEVPERLKILFDGVYRWRTPINIHP